MEQSVTPPTYDRDQWAALTADERREAIDALCGGRVRNADLTPDDLIDIGGPADHPKNPRQGDVGKITTLIATNGWHGRILVQVATPDGALRNTLCAGHHRRKAARSLGYLRVPWEPIVCTDAEALAICVADNKASDDADNDPAALLAILTEFAETDDLDRTGYDGDELDELERLVNPPAETSSPDEPGDPKEQWLCVVTCRDEVELAALFDRLTGQGYACKLVT